VFGLSVVGSASADLYVDVHKVKQGDDGYLGRVLVPPGWIYLSRRNNNRSTIHEFGSHPPIQRQNQPVIQHIPQVLLQPLQQQQQQRLSTLNQHSFHH